MKQINDSFLMQEISEREYIAINGGNMHGPNASYFMSDYAVDAIGSWFQGVWAGFMGD